MSTIVEDSHRRCPHSWCGKRMRVQIGQEDEHEATVGWVRMVHECWSCGYAERDEHWRRPKLTVAGGRSAAERLRALRMGEVVPMHYDPSPFPPSEFDEVTR